MSARRFTRPLLALAFALAGLGFPGAARAESGPFPPGTIHVRPFAGVSAIGMQGLDSYADAFIRSWIAQWSLSGMSVTHHGARGISWALVEGMEVDYQLDEQVSVGARFGYLATERGSQRTVLEGGGNRFEDVWATKGEMLLCQAGAGFNAPLAEGVGLDIALFLGAGFGSVSIEHRMFLSPFSVEEFSARGVGVGFMPEFMIRLDFSAGDSLSLGCGLGYRFGSVGSFRHGHATAITDGTTLDQAGTTVRDSWGAMLSSDYGGPYLELSLAGHF